MVKNNFLNRIVLLFLGLVLINPSLWRQKEIPKNKNVLFIAVDDMRPVLSCYGNSTIYSPNIDQLAKNGVTFTHAYCQVAGCNPSRASIMTGLRPDELQVWTNKPNFRESNPDVITIPQFFKQTGYATREIGKIFHDPAYYKDPVSWTGPSYYNVTQNGRGHKYNLLENSVPKRTKAVATESADVPDIAYIDGKVCMAAIKVLNEIKDSSFFLFVGFRRPHLPFSAPKKYWDLYSINLFNGEYKDTQRPKKLLEIGFHNSNELREYEGITQDGKIPYAKQLELLHGYFASISYVDAQIGKLMEELNNLGLAENTIVVLWAGHGYYVGDFGLWCKATNFEAATRVPLIFSGSGISTGLINSSVVELMDIYPTLVELTDFQVPVAVSGKSLYPILKNQKLKIDDFAISQFVRPYKAISSQNPKIMGYSVRTPEYRYTEWRSFPDMVVLEKELYNMTENDIEQINIAGDKRYDVLMNKLSRKINKTSNE